MLMTVVSRALVVATALFAFCQVQASDWRLAALGEESFPVSEKVARDERPKLFRVALDRLGLERVQMSRPTWIATNALERLADVPYTTADGVACHAGVAVFQGHRFVSYWTAEGLSGGDGALDFLTNSVPRGCKGSAIYSAHVTAKAASVMTSLSGRRLVVPYEECVLFFIDDAPNANWGHGARVAFADVGNRRLTVLYVNEPIVVSEGGRVLKLTAETIPTIGEGLARKPRLVRKLSVGAGNAPTAALVDGDGTRCHALLVSGGANIQNNHVRYWADLCFAYNVLRRRGIPRENIRVLWAGGNPEKDLCLKNGNCSSCQNLDYEFSAEDLNDFDLDGKNDIDGAATRSNVAGAFAEYAATLEPTDQLLVFFTDHGGTYPRINEKCNDQATLCLWRGSDASQDVKDSELAEMTAAIRCPVVMLLENCFSGGMIAEFRSSAKNRVIVTADAYDSSNGLPAIDNWTASFFGALGGHYPYGFEPDRINAFEKSALTMNDLDPRREGLAVNADRNGDGRVSFFEAHELAVADNFWTAENGFSGDCVDEPQCEATEGGLASRLFVTQYEDSTVTVRDRVATPALDPADGAVGFAPGRVRVTCPTAGATIRYTTDGSTPTSSSAVCGADGIEIKRDCTLSVCAYKSGMDPSVSVSLSCTVRKTPPEMPYITSVSQGDSTTGIVISWLTGDGTETVDILRSENESMSSPTAVKSGLAPTETSYADMTAVPGRSYYYQVRAHNAYGVSSGAVSQEAMRSLSTPEVSAVLSGTAGMTSSKIKVSWTAVTGATHYRVYRKTGSGAAEPVSDWITGREFTDTVSYSNGGASFAYYVCAATDANGRHAGEYSKETPISVVYDLSGASLVICHDSKGTEGLTAVAVKAGGSATTCYCKLKNANGTFEEKGFTEALTWTLVEGTGIGLKSNAGSYSTGILAALGAAYTAPSVNISHQSGTGNCKVRVSYTLGSKTVSRELLVVKTTEDIVKTLVVGSPEFAVPGEVRELSAYCTMYGSSSWRVDIPAETPVTWSILSGGGATLSDDGELTVWPVTAKTKVVVQAAVDTPLGPVTVCQTVRVSPSVVKAMKAVIPPTGGESDSYYVGKIDTETYGEWVDADWIDGITYYGSDSSTYNNKNWTISAEKGRNQVALIGKEMFFSFRADRNAEKVRQGLFKLRWDGGGVDFTIEQQQAPVAATPNVSVALSGVLSASNAADGSVLHYATDGEEPSDQSPVLNGTLAFANNTPVAVKAFGEWMQASDTVYRNLEGSETKRTDVSVTFAPEMAGVAAPAAHTYKDGDVFGILPTLTKSGMYFKGWSRTRGSTKKVSSGDFVGTTDSVLYAIWSKVAADEPDWIALPWNFASSMSATFVVSANGTLLSPSDCTVGIEDASAACHGSTKSGTGNMPTIGDTGDRHVFAVYSDVEGDAEETLEIRVWHPDYGYLKVLNSELTFESGSTLGTADNPYVVNVELRAEDPAADVTFGVGKTSEFAWSASDRAVVVGVEGLKARAFAGTDYYGGVCFVNPGIVDVEKTAAANSDDIWCSFFADMNLLFLTGWSTLHTYATVDDMAAYFRKTPSLLVTKSGAQVTPGTWAYDGIYEWFKSAAKVDMGDAVTTVSFGESLSETLPELMADGSHAVHLSVAFMSVTVNPKFLGEFSMHSVTCCGYTYDPAKPTSDPTSLTGLFIIDSDNDQLTGTGGASAPNSICYCPVTWEPEGFWADAQQNVIGSYVIEGLWGQTGHVMPELIAVRNFTPQRFNVVSEGWTGVADGSAHEIAVSFGDVSGAKVEYLQANGTWSTTKRTFKTPGEYVVSFRISAKGYETYFGTEKVTVRANPAYGAGLSSSFALTEEQGGGTARVVGVKDLTSDYFALTLYKGNTWEMDGNPPAVDRYCWCFTGDAKLIDVEKDAIFDNADDYWCSELSMLNLAYFGGWVPASRYATVDAAAAALRTKYGANESYWDTLSWIHDNHVAFGLGDKVVSDYLVRFRGQLDEQSFRTFVVEHLADASRLLRLYVGSGHAVTCCGYSTDDDGVLKGLFIIDSDNDMFNNGGAANAPNRITYCRVQEVDSGYGNELQIADIFDSDWSAILSAETLYAKNGQPPPFDLIIEDLPGGGKAVCASSGPCPEDLVIPDGVTELSDFVFYGNGRIKSVSLPSSLTTIGSYCFFGCSSLSSVKITGGIPDVGEHAFEGTSGVTVYVLPAMGWAEEISAGIWQGCPIKMKTFITVTADAGGTATGGGAYDSGAKITLKATPAKGYYFAGWYEGADPLTGGSADYRTASLTYTAPARNVSITARFVAATDDRLFIPGAGSIKTLQVGESFDEALEVDTESFPTVTVSGLPTGVTFDSKTLKFSGSPAKPGVYDVTISAKNDSGYTYTIQPRMIVTGAEGTRVVNHYPVVYGTVGQELRKPNGDHYFDVDFFDFDTAPDQSGGEGQLSGFACTCPGITQASYKQNVDEDPSDVYENDWYCSYGWYSGPYHPIIGTPTKAGNYTMTLTFKWSDRHSEKVEVLFVISDKDEVSQLPEVDLSAFDASWTVGAAPTWMTYVDPSVYTITMSGLPTGVTFGKLTGQNGPYYGFSGFPTKVGRYAVTVKVVTDGVTYTSVKTLTVVDAQCAYYSVLSTDESLGTVTGGGVRKPGDKVTITATAKTGCVFAGWYSDLVCDHPALTLGADWRTASQTYNIGVSTPNPLYARFVAKGVGTDPINSISCPLEPDGYTAGQAMSASVFVDSASFPTVTAKGLPAGIKFDAKTLVLSGIPTVPGEYPVTFTAKNVSGATANLTVTFKVKNYHCSLNDLSDPLLDAYDFTPGVAVDAEAVFGSQVLAQLGLGGWTVTGLPAGITFNSKTGTFSGAATAASKNYTVTFTKKGSNGEVDKGTAIFRTSAYPVLTLVPVFDGDTYDASTSGSKLTGAGSYPANKQVALSATAPKNFVFTGWTTDEAGSVPLVNGKQDFRTASSYSYTTLAEDTVLYAHFTHAANDTDLAMENLDAEYEINSFVEMPFSVRSCSLPTVKVTGLPAGLSFNAKTLVLSGTPTKPGKYTVSFTLTNLSIKQGVVEKTTITVPNIVSDKIGNIESSESYYAYTQGVSIGDGIEPEVEEGYALSVSGLPAGLSYDKKTGKITGAPTAASGAYTVTFTATKRGAKTETATITLNIAAAPTSAVGVFNGFVGRSEAEFVNLGTFKLTSAANGALSAVFETAKGKTTLSAKNWTSYDGIGLFVANFSDRSGNSAEITIDVAASFDAWQLSGSFYEKKSGTTYDITAQMNVFGQSWYLRATKVAADAWTFAYADSASEADLTVTVKADGSAAVKGKLGAYSVNATSFLAIDGLREGAFMADFVQFVTVGGVKKPLSIKANLWLDGSDAHAEGAGGAKVEE